MAELETPDYGVGSSLQNLMGRKKLPAMGPEFTESPWASYFSNYNFTGQSPYDSKADWDSSGAQQALIQNIQRQAQGDPNSYAQLQLRDLNQRAALQQQSLASSMRGQQAGAALRQGVQGAQQINRGLAGQSAMLGLQEQQGAQNLLARLLEQSREQNLQRAYGEGAAAFDINKLSDEGLLFGAREYVGSQADDARRKLQDLLTKEGYDLESEKATDARNRRLLEAGGTAVDILSKASKSSGDNSQRAPRDDDLKPPPEEWG